MGIINLLIKQKSHPIKMASQKREGFFICIQKSNTFYDGCIALPNPNTHGAKRIAFVLFLQL